VRRISERTSVYVPNSRVQLGHRFDPPSPALGIPKSEGAMTVPIGIFRRHNVYWFRLTVNGRKIRRPGGATLEEAVAARERAAAELGAASKPPSATPATTVRRLADAYLDHLRLTAKPQSIRSADYALRKVNASLGSVLARKLTAGAVDRFVAARLREVGKAEVNKELRLLRAALRFAVDRGKLETVPVRVKMLKTPRRAPTILAPEEVGRLLSSAGSLRPLLMVAAYTGLRSGELCALRRRDVDLRRGEIRVSARDGWSPKSHRDRTVPLHPALREMLQRIPVSDPDAPLFTSPRGCAWEPTGLSKAVRRVFDAAGLYRPEEKPGLHQLRRTFLSVLLHNGADVETARDLAGHSSIIVTQAYISSTSAVKRRAVEAVRFQ